MSRFGRAILFIASILIWQGNPAARLLAMAPPEARIVPASTNVALGASARLCADLSGATPFQLQWRRNGVNLTNETNACLYLEDIQLSHGGAYTVVVGNSAGVIVSEPAFVRLNLPLLQGGDVRTNRTTITGPNGRLSGTNQLAGSDPNEPRHFGKPGGKSIWYHWRPAQTGIATFRTAGSAFDTLLAIYIECSPGNLVEVASDEDSGGSLTSLVRYNARGGTNYLIVVDGFAGAEGDFVLSWSFEPTSQLLPVIVKHPQSLTIARDAAATFSVEAAAPTVEDHYQCLPEFGTNMGIGLAYEWHRNGTRIPGGDGPQLTLLNVQDGDVGDYTVVVSRLGRTVTSRTASLQLNVTGQAAQDVRAENKFVDAAESRALELGGATHPPAGRGRALAAASVVRGYTGTQVFHTSGGTSEPGDPPVCGVIGGASQWLTFVMLDTGVLHLNTDGSTYNTVLAVFSRGPGHPNILQMLACDNDSGLDGRDSALHIAVQAGSTNFVMVDGVNGRTGTLRLNYSLVTPAALSALGFQPQGFHLRVAGRPEMRFSLEASTQLTNWTLLTVTNSASGLLDYYDTAAPLSQRVYRALMLP